MKNADKASSTNPTQMQLGSSKSGSSAVSITSSNEDVEGSGSDGAEADQDEDDDDDDDADERAPSDAANASKGDQTGHKTGTALRSGACTGGEWKSSPHAKGDNKLRARRRRVSNSTSQMHDQNAESDDDDYNGVDLISDSEEEEPTVEQLEEKVIIESEEEYDSNCRTPPVLANISSDGWAGFDLEGDLFLSDVPYFDEQIGRTDPSILAEEIGIFNSTSFPQSLYDVELPPRLTPPRRVRFAEDVLEPDTSSVFASDKVGNSTEGNGPHGLTNGEEGGTSKNHDAEDEDTDSSSGRSSGYESGYCVGLCDRFCKTNNMCFQLILARRPRKKMFQHLQPHGRNHFSVVHPCHHSMGTGRQHQRRGEGSLLLHPAIAGAQPWVHGWPTQRNI